MLAWTRRLDTQCLDLLLDGSEPEASAVSPIQESGNSQSVGHPGVLVPDVGSEELQKALAGLLSGTADDDGHLA